MRKVAHSEWTTSCWWWTSVARQNGWMTILWSRLVRFHSGFVWRLGELCGDTSIDHVRRRRVNDNKEESPVPKIKLSSELPLTELIHVYSGRSTAIWRTDSAIWWSSRSVVWATLTAVSWSRTAVRWHTGTAICGHNRNAVWWRACSAVWWRRTRVAPPSDDARAPSDDSRAPPRDGACGMPSDEIPSNVRNGQLPTHLRRSERTRKSPQRLNLWTLWSSQS